MAESSDIKELHRSAVWARGRLAVIADILASRGMVYWSDEIMRVHRGIVIMPKEYEKAEGA